VTLPPSRRAVSLLHFVAWVCLVLVAGLAASARAQVVVAPGQLVSLGGTEVGGAADGGLVSCAIGGIAASCDLAQYEFTVAQPGNYFVRARHNQNIGTGLGEPHVAAAGIHDDFRIPGPPDDVVSVQVSASYDLFVSLLGVAAYEAAGQLSLILEDVTDGTPVPLGSTVLFRQDRSGDQGLTDVTTGREAYRIDGDVGTLSLALRRGRVYRVWFEVEIMGEQFVVGNSDAFASASLRRLVVQVDEDEVEQLDQHDQDVKAQLDRIEGKLDGIAEQLALVQRTQLEQTLVARDESRLTVLHTDRLQEVCDAAQQAIDASAGLGYRVKQRAQRLVDKAAGVHASDPKRAVALCRDAYRVAAYQRKLD
jgi:hypothetical protein